MRSKFGIVAAVLSAGCLASTAHAQASGSRDFGPYSVYGPGLTFKSDSSYTSPYSVYGPGLTYSGQASYSGYVRVGSVLVPDGGEALLAGYGSIRSGRNEFGAPVLGKTPYLNRGFANNGFAQSTRSATSSVRVRIIRMSEEEERQTGVRPEDRR